MTLPAVTPMQTNIPGGEPIEIISYYPEFAWYYPTCELQTKAWCVANAKSDWVTLDCGANIGYFSLLFSRLSPQGHVFAIEPTRTVEMLRQNLAHHGVKNVTVVQVALGESNGERTEKIFRVWGTDPEEAVYPFQTVDAFVRERQLTRVDCIKIDVDSFDFEVLKGAAGVLQQFNPFIIVELNHALSKRGQSNAEALQWLAQQGYEKALVLDNDNFVLRRGPGMARPQASIALHFPVGDSESPSKHPVPPLDVENLQQFLGFKEPIVYPQESKERPLSQWLADRDDGPILRYIFRHYRPRRHLEFGTWYGHGVLRCVEECDATVWTLNLPDGEVRPDGGWTYSDTNPETATIPPGAKSQIFTGEEGTLKTCYQTDSVGFIGLKYMEKKLAHRVCQIYCDSREWDTSNYPSGFFDTAFIDGGHQYDVVKSDTYKAAVAAPFRRTHSVARFRAG